MDEQQKNGTQYACGECGASVIFRIVEGQPSWTRTCTHEDAAITANIAAVAYGEGRAAA